MSRKPDFICIGPEKTATSWLYFVLAHHPQVWLPPYKELRFLNEGNLVPNYSIRNLLLSPNWHFRELRRILVRNTAKMLLLRKTSGHGPFETYAWLMRYLFRQHSFAWYESLFEQGAGLLCGDITPNYYHIPESRIDELHQHNPDAKILLFVRNPMDRAWSAALMNYCEHERCLFESVTDTQWISMLDEMYASWLPYTEVIARWQKFFPGLYFAFYDSLKESKEQFFNDVANFLEINPSLAGEYTDMVIGKGEGRAMPAKVREHLKKLYGDEIRSLARSGISPYPEQWLRTM